MAASSHPSNQDKRQFDLLIADYQACREDDRSLASVIVAAFSIAVTLIGVMAAAVTQTCEFSSATSCVHVPDYILAASPLIPIALLAYVTMLGLGATLRAFYLRGLELKLQEYATDPIMGELTVASYIGLSTEVVSLRRGRVSFRLLANLLFAAIVLIFGGYTAYVGFHVGTADQVVMAVVYSCVAALLIWAVLQGTIRGRALFTETAQSFLDNPKSKILPQPSRQLHGESEDERSLAAYLIFPRPDDWIKWVITPGVFVVAAWSTGSFSRWPTFLALWLILEYLIYSARYQWNDVRGVVEDQSGDQRRLPVGPRQKYLRRNVLVSISVGLLRLAIACVLGVMLKLAAPIFLLIILVFTIAIVYEALRSAKPVPVAREPAILERLHPRQIAIWCVVGLGYGIRAGLGFIIGGIPAANWKAIAGIILFIAFGIMFVAMTWVLGATDYCLVGPGDTWRWKPGIEAKPHIALFLRYVPKIRLDLTPAPAVLGQSSGQADGSCTLGRLQHILMKYNSFRTPWNLAFAVSIVLGSLLGPELAHVNPRVPPDLMVPSISLLGACLMIMSTSGKRHAATLLPAVCLTGALAIACVAILYSPFPKALIAVVPWLAVTLVYLIFCYSSFQDLKDFSRQIMAALDSVRNVKAPVALLVKFIIGGKTWAAFASVPLPARAENAVTQGMPIGNDRTPNGEVRHIDPASKPTGHT